MKTILMTGARSGIAADVIKKLKTKNYKMKSTNMNHDRAKNKNSEKRIS